jgi:hypothetical protein
MDSAQDPLVWVYSLISVTYTSKRRFFAPMLSGQA